MTDLIRGYYINGRQVNFTRENVMLAIHFIEMNIVPKGTLATYIKMANSWGQ